LVRAFAVDAASRVTAWDEVQFDAAIVDGAGPRAVIDSPLWSSSPDRVAQFWLSLRAALPRDHDWDVWIGWYEQRLRGGSRGDDDELVFASVPQGEWDKGPAAANAWIKAHLPTAPESARAPELPEPLPNLEAPFAFGWNANVQVAIIAGAHNLPFYRNFKSEEDHRHVLEACRVGGERLLKAVRGGRYNARPEYGEALEYYINDLPKTAGAGNILLANRQARILHDMFLADTAMLPPGFASRLEQSPSEMNRRGFPNRVCSDS
jgi:hypothetical protein